MAKSIVVVDDEKLVVYGLCSLLSDEGSEFTVAATGSCGEDGLRLCIENSPDLLLTDIGMPGMDGLELIEKVKHTNPEMKIVVLSCHDEYSLVHKAFMLGADDYILKKDIDRFNLYNLLGRILPDDPKNSGTSVGRTAIKPLSEDSKLIPEKPGSLGIIGFKSEKQNDGLIWQPDIPMLRELINDDIDPHGEYYLGRTNDLVIYFSQFNRDQKARIDHLLKNAGRSASKYINHTVFIAESFMTPGESLIGAYNRGLEILKGMFYRTESAILTDELLQPDGSFDLTFDLASANCEQSWRDSLNNYLQRAELEHINPDAVKSELNFAIKHLLHHLREHAGKDISQAFPDSPSGYQQTILNFNDITHLRNWSMDFLAGTAGELRERQSRGRAVYSTKLYVNGHLESDLSLGRVAEILAINPNHLSTVFKKTTGLSYIGYVNKKRIERACELLETTDLSAKEIAFQCGYENPNYFSRIFKKVKNITVSEYRTGGNSNQ